MNQEPNNGSGLGCVVMLLLALLISGTWVGRFMFGVFTFGSLIIITIILVAFFSIIVALNRSAKRHMQDHEESQYTSEYDDPTAFPDELEHDEANAIDVSDVEVEKNDEA